MTIRAYSETYLFDAMKDLASMMDHAVNDLRLDADRFFSSFISSGLADRFGSGDFHLISGMSGAELARFVLDIEEAGYEVTEPSFSFERSPEYWAGWALAEYQWHTGLPFRNIAESVPFSTIVRMYHPYHEMDILHFFDAMDELLQRG